MKRLIIGFLFVLFPAVVLAESGQLGCVPGASDPARGIVSGCTYFDLQKYGSMGRQIVFNEAFIEPQIVWTHQSSDAADGGRNVRYNVFCFGFCSPPSLIESGWNVGAGEILPDRAGFPTVAILEDATTVIAQHWNAQYPAGEFNALTYKNNTIGLPDYSGEWVPDSSWAGYSSGGPQETFVWPQIGHTDNGGSQVSHLLLSQWRSFDETEDTLNTIVYLRRLGATGSAWQTGLEIGQSRHYRSAVVVAERTSDNVLIAWVGPRGDGTIGGAPVPRFFGDGSGADAFDTDVYAMFSSDAGATWGSRMNLTLRADSLPGGWAPYHKISALWDGGGTAHIVWEATSWAGYGGVFTK
ncbi:MAG TPA: hypothetical protein VLB27_06205, partial [candidate division Zixibacteria bacterium]|nr:hypothetical protein [candidate division Zixibacteria bacterium]